MEEKSASHPDSAYFEVPTAFAPPSRSSSAASLRNCADHRRQHRNVRGRLRLTWKPGTKSSPPGRIPTAIRHLNPMKARRHHPEDCRAARTLPHADDFLAVLTPRTRMVSVSLVRFDNAVMLDAARIPLRATREERCCCWTSARPAARCP